MVEKKEIIIVDESSLRDKIYVIRDQQVMLDYDLAEIYGYTVSAFNQQVSRNINRFPEDFMFQLRPEEIPESIKSQNVILNEGGNRRGMHIKKMPKAFTEQGIYMLMTVLKGDLAVEQSKTLIRLFKSMKDYILENQQLMITQRGYVALAERVDSHTSDIKEIKDNMVTKADLSDFMKLFDADIEHEEILILDGQPFKADLAYQKIYRKTKSSLIIIDDYISTKTLQHLLHAKATVNLTIISDNKARPKLRKSEYDDFVSENDTFNDKSLSSNQKYLNEEDKSNIFSYINYKESIVKERFPKIANSNNRFELSNDIKKEFDEISNVFRRYNSNKKRIDDALIKIKNFNKNNLLHKNPYNQRFDDSKKIFNKIDLNILKINKNRKNISPTLMEKNLIKQKIRKVIANFSHNNTDDNMIKMKFKYKNID